MLLLQKPTLLLVDEPAAGMTDTETMRTADLLKSLAGRHTVGVVEHDMDFVEALECRVSVLHEGTVIAEGSHAHVSGDSHIETWHQFTGDEGRVTNDPMEATYIGFEMWVKAVEKAGTTDVDSVRPALYGTAVPNLTGGTAVIGLDTLGRFVQD